MSKSVTCPCSVHLHVFSGTSMVRIVCRLTMVCLFAFPSLTVGQEPQELDVVSIRENQSTSAHFTTELRLTPGRLQVVNASLEDLVAAAYGVMSPTTRDQLIVGWPNSDVKLKRFDITATLRGGDRVTQEGRRRLLLALLATRFGFKAHKEARSMRSHVLTQLKKGVLGPKLRRVDFDCYGVSLAESPKDDDGQPLCRQGARSDIEREGFILRGSGNIDVLIISLQNMLRAVVVDATGLQGNFAWEVELGLTPTAPHTPLREQLGLNLEQTQVSVDVVVIDSVSMPTPN